MRLLLKITLFTLIPLIFSGAAFAGADEIMQSTLNAIVSSDLPNALPAAFLPGSMGAFLCGIRWLLCGKVLLIIITTSVFMLGLLLMKQKLTWQYTILIVSFTLLLTQPERVVVIIAKGGKLFGAPVGFLHIFAEACTCKTQLSGLVEEGAEAVLP